MSEPKRHHILAEAYQKQFIGEGTCVWVHDKVASKTFASQPINVAVRTDFNTALLADGSIDRATMEGIFSNFESNYPQAIQQLQTGFQTSDSINHVIEFMLAQAIRSPLSRRIMSELILSLSAKSDQALRDFGVEEVDIELVNRARNGDEDAKTKIGLQSSVHLALGVGKALKNVSYRSIRLETPINLITSDNPVVYFSAAKKKGKWCSGLPLPGSRILCFFPLAKNLLLFGDTELLPLRRVMSERPTQITSSIALVKRLNALTALTAERTIIAPTKRDLDKTLSGIAKKTTTATSLLSMCSELAKVAVNISNEHWR